MLCYVCKTIFRFFLKTNTHFFNFELLICRVHQLGLECIKKSALYGAGFARRQINVGENRGEIAVSLMTQNAAHKGFCWTFPLYRPLRSLEQFRTQGFLRIESTIQRCARKSTGFASGSNIVGENRSEMENSLVTQEFTHRGFYWTFPLYMCR